MNIYNKLSPKELLSGNDYQGRGILTGTSENGKYAIIAYFIMGRSNNSRNRIFKQEGNDITIYPFDESKVEDPSLIIYSPLRVIDNKVIVTNGDQTDTIYDFVKMGKTFKEALETREFEPDGPNWTPRISSMLTLGDKYSYEVSILKSIDELGSACQRYTYSYPSVNGLGHFISTYETNGNPLPTFQGEPRRVNLGNDIDELFNDIWNTLNEENKISLVVRFIDLETKEEKTRLVNKNI